MVLILATGSFQPWRCVPVLAAMLVLFSAASTHAASAHQKTFASPEEAAQELIAAAKSGNIRELTAILGPAAKGILESGDPVTDRDGRERFVRSYEEASKLERSGDSKVVLSTGNDAWPFPIPIVKAGAGWRFDTKAGREEILNRRIGSNEISTMMALLAYVDAQREYYLSNPQRDVISHYADKFVSTGAKRDGLYYPTKPGEPASPLGPLFDRARAKGYVRSADGKPVPYLGYRYRILKAQGPDAPGGAYGYVAQGKMIGGHALVSWPATYGNSGVMTFLVNHDGVLYQKDLGPQTAAAVQKITRFNPDKTWKRAE